MLLELASAPRPMLLLPGCELLEKGAWPNWYLLEGIMDGESAPGQGEGAEEGAGWCEEQRKLLPAGTLRGWVINGCAVLGPCKASLLVCALPAFCHVLFKPRVSS